MLTLPVADRDTALSTLRGHYSDVSIVPDDDTFLEVVWQVQAYLAGELREFTVTLDLRGYSAFALAVWAAANRIAYGQTRTYRWIAEQTGGGGAGIYQAVVLRWAEPRAADHPLPSRGRLRRQPHRLRGRGGNEGAAAGPGKRPGGVPGI